MSAGGGGFGRVLVILIVVGGAVAVVGWRIRVGEGDAQGGPATETRLTDGPADTTAGAARALVPLPVRVTPVVRGTLIQVVHAEGRAQPRRRIDLPAQVVGRANGVYAREGDHVREGQLLVEIESSDYDDALRDARAALLQRQAEYAARQDQSATVRESGFEIPSSAIDPAEYRRIEEAFEKAREELEAGRMTEEEYQEIELAYRTARILAGLERGNILRAQLTAAQIAVRRAERNLERTSIRAPFEGYVANLQVQEGQYLGGGSPMLTLLDTEIMEVEVDVLESEIVMIRRGRKAEVEFSALPGEVFEGTVRSVNPLIDAESRTGRVTLQLANPDGRVTTGMFGRVRIEAAFHEDVLLVPQEAVVERNERTLVFVVADPNPETTPAEAEWRYVRLGPRNDTQVAILPDENPREGLEEGMLVCVEGHVTLQHDSYVRVVDTVPTAGR